MKTNICFFNSYIAFFYPKDPKNFLQLSACISSWNNSAPTGRTFTKFDILSIFRKSVEEIQVSFKSDKNNGYFT